MKKYVASVFTAVLGGILTLGGYKLFLEKKKYTPSKIQISNRNW